MRHVLLLLLGAALALAVPTWTEHHNHTMMLQLLADLEAEFPQLVQVHQIGTTGLGAEMMAVRITDHPELEHEPGEPQVRLLANIHGDETAGREVLLRLADTLARSYGTDAELTRLVDNIDIWIVPSVNPDGYNTFRNGVWRPKRYNNAMVDLNRDFPDAWINRPDTFDGRQPETIAIMNFTRNHHFLLSWGYHGGSMVANYPFDSVDPARNITCCVDNPSPDDAVFRKMALTYSMNHLTMHNFTQQYPVFPNGITNGLAWYVVWGGVQDWSYNTNSVFDVTLEIGTRKNPLPADLPTYWDQNLPAIKAYLNLAITMGIRGQVTSATTGEPLAATINVTQIGKDVTTLAATGDYWRLLTEGTYEVVATAPGYFPLSKTVIVPADQTVPIVLNFELCQDMGCTTVPCEHSSCPNDLSAVCTNDYCGKCAAVWTRPNGAAAKCACHPHELVWPFCCPNLCPPHPIFGMTCHMSKCALCHPVWN